MKFALGSALLFFKQYHDAQRTFKEARDLSEEIQVQVDNTKSKETQIGQHLEFIEEKNWKIVAYQCLAKSYFYEEKYETAIRAYKKLLQLAWKDCDQEMEIKAF